MPNISQNAKKYLSLFEIEKSLKLPNLLYFYVSKGSTVGRPLKNHQDLFDAAAVEFVSVFCVPTKGGQARKTKSEDEC